MLTLGHNRLSSLHEDIDCLGRLTTLHLHGNRISSVATSLTELPALQEISIEWLCYLDFNRSPFGSLTDSASKERLLRFLRTVQEFTKQKRRFRKGFQISFL